MGLHDGPAFFYLCRWLQERFGGRGAGGAAEDRREKAEALVWF